MSANRMWEEGFTNDRVEIPAYPAGPSGQAVYPVNNGAQLYRIDGTDFCTYRAYCDRLAREGYVCRKRYESAFYDCSAFFQEKNLVYVSYCHSGQTVRIITEPEAALPQEGPELEGKCELYQLSLDQREVDCGMSYVMKLCDGSFFLIDGGYFTKGECDRLYEFLREHATGPIVIAGWFCTHAHEDHFGCFMNFAEKYGSRVKVEKLYYNFPSMYLEQAAHWKRQDILSTLTFYRTINRYLGDVEQVKLHTGERFRVRNLSFEVLMTHEDLYPSPIHNFNDTSTVLMMTVNGKKMLWLGDIGDEGSDVLTGVYGDALKADLVQVSHHGFHGAKKLVYELADPVTVFWPTADYRFDENISRPANTFLLKESRNAREHLISGYGTKSLILE